jgi:hypothetical protein
MFDSDMDKKTADVIWSMGISDDDFYKIDALFTIDEINKIRKALGYAKISTGSFG